MTKTDLVRAIVRTPRPTWRGRADGLPSDFGEQLEHLGHGTGQRQAGPAKEGVRACRVSAPDSA